MKRTRFTGERIIGVPGEDKADGTCAEPCRKEGMSEGTFCNWTAEFGGMRVSEARRLKALEEENTKLAKLLAGPMPDLAAMKDPWQAKGLGSRRDHRSYVPLECRDATAFFPPRNVDASSAHRIEEISVRPVFPPGSPAFLGKRRPRRHPSDPARRPCRHGCP